MVYSYDPLYFREVTPLVRCNVVSSLPVVPGRIQVVWCRQFVEDEQQILNVVIAECDSNGMMFGQVVWMVLG